MNLNNLGYSAFFQRQVEQYPFSGLSIGRICAEYKESYRLFSEHGELPAAISGKFRNNCTSREDFPAVGDWVLFDHIENEQKAVIQSVLERKSKFSRKAAGKGLGEQVIASNVDYAFITCSLNHDFNPRRIERYLSMVWQTGAVPIIVLTKTDLCPDFENKIGEIEEIALGVDVHATSILEPQSIENLKKYLIDSKTIVLLGSSGVGKSSLINSVAGEEIMKVNELRNDIEKGRHTTTHRQMLILPEGGLIIDTPGIRELQLWNADEGISHTFEDIENVARKCKFNDCTHTNEPGCAIRQALEAKEMDSQRYKNYLKVLKEQEYLKNRQTKSAAKVERDKWKSIHKQVKELSKGDKWK